MLWTCLVFFFVENELMEYEHYTRDGVRHTQVVTRTLDDQLAIYGTAGGCARAVYDALADEIFTA